MKKKTFRFGTIVLVGLAGYLVSLSVLLVASADIANIRNSAAHVTPRQPPKRITRSEGFGHSKGRAPTRHTAGRHAVPPSACQNKVDCEAAKDADELWAQISPSSPLSGVDHQSQIFGSSSSQVPSPTFALTTYPISSTTFSPTSGNAPTKTSDFAQTSSGSAPKNSLPSDTGSIVSPVEPAKTSDPGLMKTVLPTTLDAFQAAPAPTVSQGLQPASFASTVAVPEPPTLWMFGACLALLALATKSRRRTTVLARTA